MRKLLLVMVLIAIVIGVVGMSATPVLAGGPSPDACQNIFDGIRHAPPDPIAQHVAFRLIALCQP